LKEELSDKLARTRREGVYFDTQPGSPRGFGLRVTKKLARSWFLDYTVKDTGVQRRITIGDIGAWPYKEARRQGAEYRRQADSGGDPLGARETNRAAPTVNDLWQRYRTDILPSLSAGTQNEYVAQYRDWIEPALGAFKVAAAAQDAERVERLHRRITADGKPRRADTVISLIGVLFNYAIKAKLCRDNPAKGVELNPQHGRERYLTESEVERLTAALDQWKRQDSIHAIRLLLLTGARRGEILGMRWSELDLDDGVWVKPWGRTKQRKLHRVPLPDAAIEILKRRRDERDQQSGKVVLLHKDDTVFRGGGDKAHIRRLELDWKEIRAEAGLHDVRLHDLRHSYASFLVNAGKSLEIIGALLGHSKPATTKRYAHLADKPLREAAAIVGSIVGRTS
jgi:integrase